LAICRQLAEAMGGTLSLSSEPGQGSTFRVTVPLGWHQSREPSPPPAQPTTVPAPAGVGGGLVLVVDDNTINQVVATAMLSKLGYAPEVVSDGRQAVAAVAHTRYAAVLMDCHMPVMDGYEAAQAIRAGEGAGQRMPIIAMTANVRTEDRDRCLASGMDDHVSKPFTLATLERALSLWTTPSLGLDRPPRATGVPVARSGAPRP
ncbi:MAG: response regulator, partial [Acidimicrobiales bacterium]